MARETEVAVVGAGLAGLAAARRLTAAGIDCVVLEARDRVGGRTLNHAIGDDNKVVEVGGQWVGPSQTRVLELMRELGLESFPTYSVGEHVIEYEGALKRYTGTIPAISRRVLADIGQAQWKLDRMAKQVRAEAPWEAPKAQQWDSQTFWSWMRRNVYTDGGRRLLGLATEAVWAAQPEDLSLLHVLFYISSAGGFDPLLDTEGGAQDARVVGGTQLISLRMAEELGDRVILDSPVRSIEHAADRVEVRADGISVEARRAIVALPPTLTCRIAYDPPLPALRDQLTQRIPQGTVAKCMAVYDTPFWRERGLTGQGTSDTGPVKLTFDNSPPDGSPGVLLGFLEGRQARELGSWEPQRRREAVIDCFTRLFGAQAAEPNDYVEKLWADEEWTRGCYGCYMPTGAWTAFGRALREPVGAIHWAGAETATVWSGYMDGAVRSGDSAADAAAASLAGTGSRFATA